jgi:hypothetical protein
VKSEGAEVVDFLRLRPTPDDTEVGFQERLDIEPLGRDSRKRLARFDYRMIKVEAVDKEGNAGHVRE